MSDLSLLYSEYERISGLFRSLNEAALVARRSRLGLSDPSKDEVEALRQDLQTALDRLTEESGTSPSAALFADNDLEISTDTLTTIGRRAKHGLHALTERDLEVIEKITNVLDSRSEMLFRRIQK